eukprot:TRINITY_DN964_c0_g2_i1.p1 TRINITY_DN964_c0_g2~~TRINITY_DN964_c0_g2_i1.p1  ORF type:complete len:1789 (+),score=650.94 TRINITY_DN964_c0_g2_i1:95-5461(+)
MSSEGSGSSEQYDGPSEPINAWSSGPYQAVSQQPALSGGGCCGKGLYLSVVGATIVIACAAVGLRAQTDVIDLVVARAELNKVQQCRALGLLMEAAAAVVQDGEQSLRALGQLAHSLNREYLRGSFEVQLVHRIANCANPAADGSCGIRILTQPRSERFCPTPEEASSAAARVYRKLPGVSVGDTPSPPTTEETASAVAPQCDMHQVLPVARVVLDGQQGTLRAKDYTLRDVLYAYRPVRGTTAGLILKQDLDEIMDSTDFVSELRWYGGMITYVGTGLFVSILFCLLMQIERGKGWIAKMALGLVAILGFLVVVFLMWYTETGGGREEGHLQQKRETGDGAAVLLAGYQALVTAKFGAPGVFDSILQQWLQGLNEQLDPGFEAVLVRTMTSHRGDQEQAARFAEVISRTRTPCEDACAARLAADVVRYADPHPDGRIVTLYNGDAGFIASAHDEGLQRWRRTQVELGWMVKNAHVTGGYDSAADDLWKRVGLLLIGYVPVVSLASFFAARYIPDPRAGMANGSGSRRPWQRLSWMMPLVFLMILSVQLLMVVTMSTTALGGIGGLKEAYLTRAHGEAVIEGAVAAQGLARRLEAVYRAALITGDTQVEQAITEAQRKLAAQLRRLHGDAEWLEGSHSATALCVRSLPEDVTSFLEAVGLPAVGSRKAATLQGNATFLVWKERPDEQMATARGYLDGIRSRAVSENPDNAQFDPRGTFVGRIFALESVLWDLEILLRQEVISMNKAHFTKRYAELKALWDTKLTALQATTAWSEIASGTQAAFLNEFTLIQSTIEQNERDLSRFELRDQQRQRSSWGAVVAEGLHSQVQVDVKVLTGDQRLVTQSIPAESFFGVIVQQLERVATAARIHVMRNVYVRNNLGIERDAVLRAQRCAAAALLVAFFAAVLGYYLYVKDAECNKVSHLPGVVDYPSREIRDFGVQSALIGVIFLLELVVIASVAQTQFDEIEDNHRDIAFVARGATAVAEWMHETAALVSVVNGYGLTGEEQERELYERHWAVMQELEQVGLHPVSSAPDSVLDPSIKQDFANAVASAVDLAVTMRQAAAARAIFDRTTPTYSYDTLRLLVSERAKDTALDTRLKQAENLNLQTRSQMVARHCAELSPGESCESRFSPERIEAVSITHDDSGRPFVRWSPQTRTLQTRRGYHFRFINRLPTAGGRPAALCIGPFSASAAVWKVQTAISEWDVPYFTRVSVYPGEEVSAYIYLVEPGTFRLYDDTAGSGCCDDAAEAGCGAAHVGVTVNVEAADATSDAGVDPGLPLLVQERLCDPRRSPRHAVWGNTSRFDVQLQQTGGFRSSEAVAGNSTVLQLVEGRPYRVGVQGYASDDCRWVLVQRNRYCQTDLRKDISDNMGLAVCQAVAVLDPDCGDTVYGNGVKCRCLLKGAACDFLASSEQNSVYKLQCGGVRAGSVLNESGLDVTRVGGKVLWSAVEDFSGSIEIPHLTSIKLRQGAPLGARTFMALLPVDRGMIPVQTTRGPQVPWAQIEITKGCYEHQTEELCSAPTALECLWDGERCRQNYNMVSAESAQMLSCSATHQGAALRDRGRSAFEQGRLSDNLWNRLELRRAAQRMHTQHLAYVISADPAHHDGFLSQVQIFRNTLEKVQNVGAGLEGQFDDWLHALEMESAARSNLTRTIFVEDVLLNVTRSQGVGPGAAPGTGLDAVLLRFEGLRNRTQALLGDHMLWSEHNLRFIFWSTTACCWFFTAMAALILQRLDIVVTVSNDFCYRNVPLLTPVWEGSEGTDFEEEEEDEGEEAGEEEEVEEDESM